MEVYESFAREEAKRFTKRYSTSFSMASTLFPTAIRDDIFAIYGLVRLADEIVDTYRGVDARGQLDALEAETYVAIRRDYSTNLIVEAFQITAKKYGITRSLIRPFFASMRADLDNGPLAKKQYETYIYGSAEVIGLMCLRVFVAGDSREYTKLSGGAQALGAAFQKINFLRDMAADHRELSRYYFPVDSFDTFTTTTKQLIIDDIHRDLAAASIAIEQLPRSSKAAVWVSYRYFSLLLDKLEKTPPEQLKQRRIRTNDFQKFLLLVQGYIAAKVNLS